MGVAGADWLERPERVREEQPDKALDYIGIAPGSAVADIGAGSGYFTTRLARRVGPTGKVYANDIQQGMLLLIADKVGRIGLKNVDLVLGTPDDPQLPANSLDLALMVDVYHELEFPREVLASLVRALKPDGRIVFVEYRAEDALVPIKSLHKMSEAQVKREAAQFPLDWERTVRTLPWQHAIVFRRRSR
jgi:ubiquinone/menaquinone biosynthesis C-methylase UbiE